MVKFSTAVMTIMASLAAHVHGAQLNTMSMPMSSHGNMMRNASGLRRTDANTNANTNVNANVKQTKGIMKLSDDEREQFLADFQARGRYAHRHRHLQTSIGWKPVGNEIQAAADAYYDRAGNAVSSNFDGSRVAIASYYHNNKMGHVRVFDLIDDQWVQVGRDLDGLGGDEHGSAISLSDDGTRLAVGAPNHSNYLGTTRVYTYDADSNSWVGLGTDIDGLRSQDKQGAEVSFSGDGITLAIGAPEAGGGQLEGYVRMYKYDETISRWTQFGNRLEGEYYHTVGSGLAVNEDGTRVAVAGKFHPTDFRLAGAVKVYQLDNSNPASPQWVPMGDSFFGSSYYELLGDSVDLNAAGDRIAIGASNADLNGKINIGKAIVYQWLEEEWVQLGTTIYGSSTGDALGRSISISAVGDRIAVGIPLFDVGEGTDFQNIGAARIFDYKFDDTPGKEEFDWVQVGPSIVGECKNDNSARSLDLSKDGKRVVIGAPLNDYYNGHARVFEATEGYSGDQGSSCYTFPPTPSPSNKPTNIASAEPTGLPTSSPSVAPTKTPTLNPTGNPTTSPTVAPSKTPTLNPTDNLTNSPTVAPSKKPTLNPTGNPTTSPTSSPVESPKVKSDLLFGISLEGICECSTEISVVLSNYLEAAWQSLFPNIGFDVESIQCEGVCSASRGPGDIMKFLIDAVQSVNEGDEDLFADPVSSVAAINQLLVDGGAEELAAQTGLPITGATAAVPTESPTKNPTSNPTLSPPVTDSPTKSPVKAPTPPATTSGAVSGYGSVGVSTMLASVSAIVFLILN